MARVSKPKNDPFSSRREAWTETSAIPKLKEIPNEESYYAEDEEYYDEEEEGEGEAEMDEALNKKESQ